MFRLLQKKAKLNVRNDSGMTAVHIAASWCKAMTMKKLLRALQNELQLEDGGERSVRYITVNNRVLVYSYLRAKNSVISESVENTPEGAENTSIRQIIVNHRVHSDNRLSEPRINNRKYLSTHRVMR